MMPRYPDEVVKSNITGFFDEFIMLVDKDGSGKIDVDEFRPVWDIMRRRAYQFPAQNRKRTFNPLKKSRPKFERLTKGNSFIELLKDSMD